MPKNDEEIIQMYVAGVPLNSIAVELRTSPTYIYRVLRQNDVPTRGHSRRHTTVDEFCGFSPEDFDKIVKLYREAKMSAKAIADTYNFPYSRVLRAVRNAGLQLAPGIPSGRTYKGLEPQIMAAYRTPGVTVVEILRRFKISATTLYHVLRKNGVTELRRAKLERGMDRTEVIVNEALLRLKEETSPVVKIEQLELPFGDWGG